jgi:hypothetical protein
LPRLPLTALTGVLDAFARPLDVLPESRERIAGDHGEGTETNEQKEENRS